MNLLNWKPLKYTDLKLLFSLIFIIPMITGFDSPVKERDYITNEKTDRRFLELINQYRVHYNKPTLKWNAIAYKMAIHHTEFQYHTKTVCHNEIETENLWDLSEWLSCVS